MGVTFERLYRRHAGDVYRYALVVMRNPQDAEDVTQTTFLNAYRAMEAGQEPAAPRNWLIAIAHNVCRQRFRQQQRRPFETPLNEDLAEAIVSEQEDGYSAEDIQRALGQLAFSQRSALVLRELEGRSYAEIAEILGLSASAVETLIFRARRALREQLEGTLTCAEAERFLSKQADGELSRADRGQLRAHLRQCAECATLARKQRASRSALRGLWGGLPVPSAFLGGGGGVALATKAAAVLVGGAVFAGGGYAVERDVVPHPVQAAKALVGPGSASRPDQVRAAPVVHVAVVAQPGSRRSRNQVRESLAPPRRHTPVLPAEASPVAVAAVAKPRPVVPGSPRSGNPVVPGFPRSGNQVPVSRPASTGPNQVRASTRHSQAASSSHPASHGSSAAPGSRRSGHQVPDSSAQAPAQSPSTSHGQSQGNPPQSPPGQSKPHQGGGAVAPEPVVPLPATPVDTVTTAATTTVATAAQSAPGHSKAGK